MIPRYCPPYKETGKTGSEMTGRSRLSGV